MVHPKADPDITNIKTGIVDPDLGAWKFTLLSVLVFCLSIRLLSLRRYVF
jgi:hypothetical protein